MRVYWLLFSLAAFLAIGKVGASHWENRNFAAKGPLAEERILVVESETSLRAMAQDFAREGIQTRTISAATGQGVHAVADKIARSCEPDPARGHRAQVTRRFTGENRVDSRTAGDRSCERSDGVERCGERHGAGGRASNRVRLERESVGRTRQDLEAGGGGRRQ